MILRVFAALIVGAGLSILSAFIIFMPDVGPNEGPLDRALLVSFLCLLGGLYVGILLPRVWYLSVVIAWPALLNIFNLSNYDETYLWIMINTILLSSVVALISGYVGARIHEGFNKRKTKRPKYQRYSLIVLLALAPLYFSYCFIKEWRASESQYIGMGNDAYMLVEPSPLHEAAEQGNLVEINRLIGQGEDINVRDVVGYTPLHYAVGEQQVAAVKLLLSKGADPDIKGNRYHITPLHWAVGSGNLDIVKLIAPKVKRIDAQNRWGETAADIAFTDHQEDILRILLAHGARIDTDN